MIETAAVMTLFFAAIVAVVFPLLWLLDRADRERRELEAMREEIAEARGALGYRLGVKVDGEDLTVGEATPTIGAVLPMAIALRSRRKGWRS